MNGVSAFPNGTPNSHKQDMKVPAPVSCELGRRTSSHLVGTPTHRSKTMRHDLSRIAVPSFAVLGLGGLWKEHAGKTGYVLPVYAKTHQTVSTISYKQEVIEIKSTLTSALKG